jgi:hypothetical protein
MHKYRLKILLGVSHIGFVELATNSSLMLMEWRRISQTSYVANILMLAALLAALLQLLALKGLVHRAVLRNLFVTSSF